MQIFIYYLARKLLEQVLWNGKNVVAFHNFLRSYIYKIALHLALFW